MEQDQLGHPTLTDLLWTPRTLRGPNCTPLRQWNHLGISYIHQLCKGETILPFPYMREICGVPEGDIFPYLQLKHTVNTHVTFTPTPNHLDRTTGAPQVLDGPDETQSPLPML
ncbi:Hypothetical predicted protein [Pelobates cultripes]|uniref:Uncharacterized protein n=1 Tax=Pelobates cultripes TaxID=61616 RepID=A0AAD1RXC6_PELCU|nr:Hypothetical predicted protein [Pelobates cultripes]